jgi:glycosyltransferase involved in cell wall biosynthesis
MATVSVVATVLNERVDIEALVSSLCAQQPEAEVIIVDGGSSDGTWEWLQSAQERFPGLIAIRDESCNRKQSPGPIARGRNVGIAAASASIVACADAGCRYTPDWLARLVAPIIQGNAQYSLGGSCLDPEASTTWDVASAPFFGVKLDVAAPTKSCTARSMAFSKELWEQVGTFPETVFLGEDALFDMRIRATNAPAFPPGAKAFYRPRHTLRSALSQLASYAVADGLLGIRPARLARNVARCVADVVAILLLPLSIIPFLFVFALEAYFAYRLDWRDLRAASPRLLGARLLFSLIVPWVVAWNQITGSRLGSQPLNRQNAE